MDLSSTNYIIINCKSKAYTIHLLGKCKSTINNKNAYSKRNVPFFWWLSAWPGSFRWVIFFKLRQYLHGWDRIRALCWVHVINTTQLPFTRVVYKHWRLAHVVVYEVTIIDKKTEPLLQRKTNTSFTVWALYALVCDRVTEERAFIWACLQYMCLNKVVRGIYSPQFDADPTI